MNPMKRTSESVDELDLLSGGDGRFLVLETVARADLDDFNLSREFSEG
jgi:hypothetical protein